VSSSPPAAGPVLVQGDPGHAITDFANKESIDVLVLCKRAATSPPMLYTLRLRRQVPGAGARRRRRRPCSAAASRSAAQRSAAQRSQATAASSTP
jgi:hypothetical protein